MPTLSKGQPGPWIARRVSAGDLVLDVGANVGDTAEHFLKTGATVYAFEPDARCWTELESRAHGVTVFRVAVAAETRQAEMTLATNSAQNSLRPEAVNAPESTVLVLTMRLDDLLETPAAVKIDVQGGELDVLRGATQMLCRCPLWVLEIWPQGLPRDGVEDIWELMKRHGLSPYTLDEPPERVSRDELMAWTAAAEWTSFINLAWM